MMSRIHKITLLLALVLATPVYAITISEYPDSPRDGLFSIKPARVVLNYSGTKDHTFTITLQNRTGANANFVLSATDMVGSNNDSGYEFTDTASSKHSLRSFIKAESNTVSLAHGAVAKIPITLSLPNNLTSSLFGAVLITLAPSGLATDQSAKVSSRIAVPIIIAVDSSDPAIGSIEELSVPTINWSTPVSAKLTYKNSGETFLVPSGYVQVINSVTGSKSSIVLPDWYILPDSTREISLPIISGFTLGRYLVRAEVAPTENSKQQIASKVIWVLPILPIVIVLAVMLILYLIYKYLRNFEIRVADSP